MTEQKNNEQQNAVNEKKQALKQLMEKGKEKGSLSYNEVNALLDKLEFTEDQKAIVYDQLHSEDIELQEDFAIDSELKELEEEISVLPSDPDDMEALLQSEGITIDDPVKIYLHEIGRAEYVPVTDDEAVNAFEYIARTEGIICAIESAHAVAHLMKIAPTMSKDDIIICCLSGRGDKDVAAIARYRGIDLHE